jgi:L-alanine-DL-glutamate epimerase-like enolase superfamily enzyme
MVLQNDDLNQVTWEMRAMAGSPQFLPSQHLPTVDFAAFARSLGLDGIHVNDADAVEQGWQAALGADRPCVIVFRTDPAIPPIPPHATWDQISKAAESIIRGDSDRVDVVKEGVKNALAGVLPGHHHRGGRVSTATVERVDVSAYTIPTDGPEADGTFEWDSTTIVLVHVAADGQVGTGWTYAAPSVAHLIRDTFERLLLGRCAIDIHARWDDMVHALRNLGRPGMGSMALSAVDCALWDLKARLLQVPLHRLLGAARDSVPLYGSGGFTTYDQAELEQQLRGWVEDDGLREVKIKIGQSSGQDVERDLARTGQARVIVGPDVALFVDANGGYSVGQAVRVGQDLDQLDVRWFEEPVTSDDLPGLRRVREACRADVAAGEYGWDVGYFERMASADAVDCLQVDVTRCGGITELLRIAAVAAAHHLDVSGHCAPHEHAPVLAAVPNLRHLEWFHDHVRIENRLFEGAGSPIEGSLPLDDSSPGNGLTWRAADAERYRVA